VSTPDGLAQTARVLCAEVVKNSMENIRRQLFPHDWQRLAELL
jgi:hypothetical protein